MSDSSSPNATGGGGVGSSPLRRSVSSAAHGGKKGSAGVGMTTTSSPSSSASAGGDAPSSANLRRSKSSAGATSVGAGQGRHRAPSTASVAGGAGGPEDSTAANHADDAGGGGEDIPAVLPRLAQLQQQQQQQQQQQHQPAAPLVAPTPSAAFGSAFGGMGSFTPLEHGSPDSTPWSSQPNSRRSSFAHSQRPGHIQQQHPLHSGPQNPAASRRGSFAHPNASGPRPPPLRRDSMASGYGSGYGGAGSAGVTPSLLSRAGSPTLPLMNDKTSSRASSRRGSFVGGAGSGGFGTPAGLEMSGMFPPPGGRVKAPTKDANAEFVGAVDCGTTSTRFIVFDKTAKIICEDQREFEQHWPHPGWHEHEPMDLIDSVRACIEAAVEKLEFLGYSAKSIKCIGITNQRETTLAWDKKTGKPLCRAMVWDDARTVAMVRDYQKRLDEEGIPVGDDERDLLSRTPGSGAHHENGATNGFSDAVDRVAVKLTNGLKIDKTSEKDNASATNGKKTTDGLATPTVATDDAISGGKRRRKGKDALVDITGLPLSTYFSATKMRWMLDHHPEVRKAEQEGRLAFGTVDSWLVYQLSGGAKQGLHIMDCSNASRTLLMSLKSMTWYKPLLEFFGIPESSLPKIVSSSEVYGHVADGPIAGVPIAGMIGDQQAALVGNKCLSRGEAKNTYGTGSFVLFNTGHEPVRSENGLITTLAYRLGPNQPPTYALEGSIAVAGSAIKWLRDQIGLIDESSEMDILCSHVKDNGGVYFVTGFSGLLAPYWDPNATGMIVGLTQYSTSAHIARATLEAVCFQTRAVLDVIEKESGTKLEELKVDGGVTNSDLAMQTQADIGGFRVCRPYMRESTALGSALLAASACGLFGWDLSKPDTLSEVNTEESTIFEPQLPEKQRVKMIRGWSRAVERARAWHTTDDGCDEREEEWEKEAEGQTYPAEDTEETNTIG